VNHQEPDVTVVIPTHNPDLGRLRRTLAGLRAQTMPADKWETVLVDNASSAAVDASLFSESAPSNLRIVHEPVLGLASARRRGVSEARAHITIFVDDDNLLAPDYLSLALILSAQHPHVGAFGGRSMPEFEREPAPWQREFFDLLAVRDMGDLPVVSRGLRPPGALQNQYPVGAAPIGAGMVIRTDAAMQWLNDLPGKQGISDRRGGELSSGGDNDIVLTVMKYGWEVAYFPDLRLVHIIPAGRLEPTYLGRLNRGIQKSWMEVLTKHEANPWPPISEWTVPMRQWKAWFTKRAWSGAAARIRWQGACGHFEGRTQALN
jgi:glycosyltransferase involved in cell wall biosynthesis